MDQIFTKMEREEAWIAPYYAGDYLTMVQENENLAFCFPEEGFNLFIDAICIPKGCSNKAAAEAYINSFLCCAGGLRPEPGIPRLLHADFRREGLHGPGDCLQPHRLSRRGNARPRAGFFHLSQTTNQLMDSLWLDVKTTGNTSYLIIIGAAIVVIALVLVVIFVRRKKKLAKRRASYEK